jgi:hypothetical protein
MRTCKLALAVMLAVVALVALARAQGIEFGRVGNTSFRGRADTIREVGNTKTYSGNVTISFPDAAIVLHADAVTFDANAGELVVQGTARLKLDNK